MKKRNLTKLKRVIARGTIFGIVSCCLNFSCVRAEGSTNHLVNKLNIPKYLVEEAYNDCTDINTYEEVKLNLQGVSDEDINNFSTETIDLINSGAYYLVDVAYCKIDDSVGADDESEVVVLNNNEVCELFDTYGVEGKEVIEEKVVSKAANSAGTNVAQDSSVSPSGMFKQTIVLVGTSTKNVYKIDYTGKWLSSPVNRSIDVFGVYTKGCTIQKSTVKSEYYADDIANGVNRGKVTYNENKYLKINTQGVATRCNLKNDSSSHKYLNHTAHITCNVIRDYSKNMTNISAYGEYYHQEKKLK